jgi:hypothetical protein
MITAINNKIDNHENPGTLPFVVVVVVGEVGVGSGGSGVVGEVVVGSGGSGVVGEVVVGSGGGGVVEEVPVGGSVTITMTVSSYESYTSIE